MSSPEIELFLTALMNISIASDVTPSGIPPPQENITLYLSLRGSTSCVVTSYTVALSLLAKTPRGGILPSKDMLIRRHP